MRNPNFAARLAVLSRQFSKQTPEWLPCPASEGSQEIRLSRTEVEALLNARSKRHRRQLWIFGGLLSLTIGALATMSMNIAQLGERYADQTLQYEALNTSLSKLSASAERLGGNGFVQGASDIETQLDAISNLLTETERAFRLYIEITHDLVSERRDNINSNLELAGIDPNQALGLSTTEQRLGGLESGTDPMDQILAHYLDDTLNAALSELSSIAGFQENLPDLRPVIDSQVTSNFGMRLHPITGKYRPHLGIDLVSDTSSDILAGGSGRVTFAGHDGGYGKKVVIDHGMGVETVYAHLSHIDVEEDQWVRRGDQIGVMGMTGKTTGVHLHYEVRFEGEALDPAQIFDIGEKQGEPAISALGSP